MSIISSSDTSSPVSSGLMPNIRKMPLADTVSSHTNGAKAYDTKVSIPDKNSESFSGLRMAMRLGMSSPNTMEK